MCFWSTTVWLIFEALNLVLKNWGYVAVAASGWIRWPGYALAFATVLPGVLLTAQVYRGPGGLEKPEGPALQPGSLAAGVPAGGRRLSGLAPGLSPLRLPPGLGGVFLPAGPLLRSLGGPSLIARFLRGERREHLCLLAAGLICGLWWEAWNWFAISKWVYTLPVLNFWKVFEMPLLGFLGFPPFALECCGHV